MQDYILQRAAKISQPRFALFSGIYTHVLGYINNFRSVKNAAASLLASLVVRRLFSNYFNRNIYIKIISTKLTELA